MKTDVPITIIARWHFVGIFAGTFLAIINLYDINQLLIIHS
ncbi:MAG: hypothetical protein ACN6O3_21765 [Comamonas sp.]